MGCLQEQDGLFRGNKYAISAKQFIYKSGWFGQQMPPDKSPGLDGFNGIFLKKCWPIIKEEFYKLADDFHSGTLKLQNINGSYITLVPKCQTPSDVNDFSPISLSNVYLKFLTKLVANRLQEHILRCIHKNQYGFLKSKSI